MVYLYPEKDLRRCPGTVRGTEEWESTYKIRTSVERSINHIKDSFCLGDRKTQNAKTLHADLLLAGITQLITVVVADSSSRELPELNNEEGLLKYVNFQGSVWLSTKVWHYPPVLINEIRHSRISALLCSGLRTRGASFAITYGSKVTFHFTRIASAVDQVIIHYHKGDQDAFQTSL